MGFMKPCMFMWDGNFQSNSASLNMLQGCSDAGPLLHCGVLDNVPHLSATGYLASILS